MVKNNPFPPKNVYKSKTLQKMTLPCDFQDSGIPTNSGTEKNASRIPGNPNRSLPQGAVFFLGRGVMKKANRTLDRVCLFFFSVL